MFPTLTTSSDARGRSATTDARAKRPRLGITVVAWSVGISLLHVLPLALVAQETAEPYRRFEKTNRVVLDVGAAGSFDSTQAKYPCVLCVGDEWWLWYNGRSDDHFTGSIGLATSTDGLK